jgi:sugar (pentulose or hexulose) kinase
MVVLEKPLEKVYPEVGVVATPGGKPVAMVHFSNCTSDMNRWVAVMKETLGLFSAVPDDGEMFTKLYQLALSGAPDCGGVTVCNYLTGESVPHLDAGRPLVLRGTDADFTIPNFLRAQLYSTMVTLSLGMKLMEDEHIRIDSLTGHGGLFKTPVVGQRYLAAALEAPITVMDTAENGGPWGMALLSAYMMYSGGLTLEDYLSERVFAGVRSSTLAPDPADVEGFRRYRERFEALLAVERKAIETM